MDIQTRTAIYQGQLEAETRRLENIIDLFDALILDAADPDHPHPRPDIANALGTLCEDVTGRAPTSASKTADQLKEAA